MKVVLVYIFFLLIGCSSIHHSPLVSRSIAKAQNCAIAADQIIDDLLIDLSEDLSMLNKSYSILKSKEEAVELFEEIKKIEGLPLKYTEYGCNARAHKISQYLDEKLGVLAVKIWAWSDDSKLRFHTPYSTKGYHDWKFHIMPAVILKENDVTQILVLDPTMFDHPVTPSKWIAKMTTHTQQLPEVHLDSRFIYLTNKGTSNPGRWNAKFFLESSDDLDVIQRLENRLLKELNLK